MKKTLRSLVLIIVIILCATGCGSKKYIIGDWKNNNNDNTYHFDKDGTGTYMGTIAFTYKEEKGKVFVTFNDFNVTLNGEVSKDSLKMYDLNGDAIKYSKVSKK